MPCLASLELSFHSPFPLLAFACVFVFLFAFLFWACLRVCVLRSLLFPSYFTIFYLSLALILIRPYDVLTLTLCSLLSTLTMYFTSDVFAHTHTHSLSLSLYFLTLS
jgi:hypothetical protein